MGVFILSQSYSGILISILTIPTVPIPINSVVEMVNQKKIGWGVEAGSIMQQIGQSSDPDSVWGYVIKTLTATVFNPW